MRNKLLGRIFSAAALCALILTIPFSALADDPPETVRIRSAEEFLRFAENCAYDAWSRDRTIILERDISLSGTDYLPAASFSGTFEGSGHTISGLELTQSAAPAGLFGIIGPGGIVRDLNVDGSVAPGGSGERVGGIAGINRGAIIDCVFSGTVSGEKMTGGICGENTASGLIRLCETTGGVFGRSMTGGVAGSNSGTVSMCVNRAYVNTNTVDPTVSLDDLDLDLGGALRGLSSPDTYNVATDSGGVAGFSDGTLSACRNYGTVGYQHIGYNVGGIAGRSSGHVSGCTNAGQIYGRKDVGGVVGIAEPYVTLNLTENSLDAVRLELDALSALVDRAANDASGASDTISARLTAVGDNVDTAERRAQDLTGRLADTYDEAAGELDRGSEILDTALPMLSDVTADLISASGDMGDSMDALQRALTRLEDRDVSGNLNAAIADLRTASDILDAAVEKFGDGQRQLSAVLENYDTLSRAERDELLYGYEDEDGAHVDGAMDNFQAGLDLLAGGRAGDAGGVSWYFNDAMAHMTIVVDALEEAAPEVKTAAREASDAADGLNTSLVDTQTLLNYLQAQDRLHVPALGEETDSAADALYDALHGVSNQLELLNSEAKSASDRLIADVRQINNQFMRVMDALFGVVEDAEGASVSTRIEDTSDEDIDAAVSGKVLRCVNQGAVSGDIDVGGVAGSMMVYNELNPEGDDTVTLSSLIHRTYELKCVLQDCVNSGEVTGKRSNVGAVCGDAQLGVIYGCEGYGRAESENGDYVGGIAGRADNIIRRCWARCALSGRKYVGGIAGADGEEDASLRVEQCRSLVEITGATQYAGAVCGADTGSFAENRFVSDALAGIDRVSLAGAAEPISYGELLEEAGLPPEFLSFTLSFVANGEVIRSQSFHYGDSFDGTVFPAIPAVEGQYAVWDRADLTDLRFDTTVTAVYSPNVTALPCDVTRSSARPVFFALGAFAEGDELKAAAAILGFEPEQGGLWSTLRAYHRTLLEQWELNVPADGAETHTLRYLPPRAASGALELYVSDGEGWARVETEDVGSYLSFDAAGEDIRLTVVSVSTPWWIWVIVGVLALSLVVFLVVLLLRRKPKHDLTEEEKEKAVRFRKRRKRALVILLAAVVVLGAVTVAALRFAPDVASLEIYTLLRSYSERSETDMDLSLSLRRADGEYRTSAELYTTECDGKRVTCATWQRIPVYFCDNALLLENGKAFRADDAFPDYTGLLAAAADLYRAMDVTVSERNGVRTYQAEVGGGETAKLLETYLPAFASDITAPDTVRLELAVTDGEPTSLRAAWSGGDAEAEAGITFVSAERDHTIPQAVRNTVVTGEYAAAPEAGEDLVRILTAWTELASREPLDAEIALRADCGPLLLDETLEWQRSQQWGQGVSRLTARGTTLYFTEEAACTAAGRPVASADSSLADAPRLLRLAYEAFLLGEPEKHEDGNGTRYSLMLDAAAMAEFADVIAPEIGTLNVMFEEGSLRMSVSGGKVAELTVQCGGTVRVVRRDVPASVSADVRFGSGEAFGTLPAEVAAALGLDG